MCNRKYDLPANADVEDMYLNDGAEFNLIHRMMGGGALYVHRYMHASMLH